MERRKFARAFKVEAVKLIQGRGVTVAQAARDLGVHGTVLRRWVQESAANAQQAFPGQGQMKPEQAELARLRREVIKLKAERDILKKAAAYFANAKNQGSSSSATTGSPSRWACCVRPCGSPGAVFTRGLVATRAPEHARIVTSPN